MSMIWDPEYIPSPAPGEIDPDRLVCWFREAVESLELPEDAIQCMVRLDSPWYVQDLLLHGSGFVLDDMLCNSGSGIDINREETSRYLDRIADIIGSRLRDFDGWIPQPLLKVSWSAAQYESLLKGYQPDMDMRFSTFRRDGCFYIYRSCYIVKKFQVGQGADGLWHITSQFTTCKEDTERILDHIVEYGYWSIHLRG